ncbi:hypothetical protein KW807_02670, partial [Candidatus Parcubacteria bacterium]|nr:hypothetical protein [Candidatus Parcubacteria bacterium]
MIACSNPSTPTGYAGYLVRGAILGSEHFYGVQLGPKSPGMSWMMGVTNVSITPYTFTEAFTGDSAVLAKDNVKLEFQAHAVFKLKSDEKSVRDFFEHYSFIDHSEKEKAKDPIENAYDNYLKEPFRTYIREQVQKRDGLRV